METMYYIGLDVHKRTISYCVKDVSGRVYAEGSVPATRFDLDRWMKTLPQPWTAAMEATMFSGWIYDHLKPHAAALKAAWARLTRAQREARKAAMRAGHRKAKRGKRRSRRPTAPLPPRAIAPRPISPVRAPCSWSRMRKGCAH